MIELFARPNCYRLCDVWIIVVPEQPRLVIIGVTLKDEFLRCVFFSIPLRAVSSPRWTKEEARGEYQGISKRNNLRDSKHQGLLW